MTATPAEHDAMRRALDAARRGPRGINPQVGAVILSPAGDILAEGWHRGAGTPHAEVDALSHLSPGDAAPDFTLASDTGDRVSLADLRGKKVIVYFYPAAMTPGCTKQACDFSESLDSLRGAGYEVLGVSKDKPAKLAKFRERDALTLTLLSDPELEVHRAYGAYGEKKLYGKTVEGVLRSTFVIDEQGKIELAQYNVKATGHVAKLRRDLGLAE